ncbi:6-phosphogluconolactonase [uncultured Roseburia sp.]|uniref:Lactonase family protein n=1 Tax=Brotonthovivens ammoniilytica TaxID=2981725 RepID=A0ABT2TMD9_9FIRM|nr:beta-propeller fold lactonase family protein [Brotonthovivens ammoniilytica]MCU6763385.1 lactonase family protein [Brotonthovivens ammoniilytica]SCJ17485.1 6-phosphogluconolactonase [uncultured Roseburia sp.]
MAKESYVAYVGTYTRSSSLGIHIFDIDTDNWSMKERKVVPINNPSDLIVSANGKYLYSIADEGVRSFKILPDGDLKPMNAAWIGGMRGCYLEVDDLNRYLFVAGYHDGRVTMMHLNEDGTIGKLACGIFHEGVGGSVAERNSIAHVTCVKVTIDQKYLCAVDSGIDQVKVYEIDYEKGNLKLCDILRGHLDNGPRMIRFRKELNCAYVLCERKNCVYVYHYDKNDCMKERMELIQEVPTVEAAEVERCASSGIEFSPDGKHLFVSNAGVNSVTVYSVDQETGLLTEICQNSTRQDYPKTLAVMPDNEHFVVLNHSSNQICSFKMNYDKNYFLMDSKPIDIHRPNCIFIHKLGDTSAS